MAQQLDAKKSTPPSSPVILHPTMGQERNHSTDSTSPSSNIIIEPKPDHFSPSSSISTHSSIIVLLDRDNEIMPLLLSSSEDSSIEQQDDKRDPNSYFNSPFFEHAMQPSPSDVMYAGTRQEYELLPSLPPSPGEPSLSHQHSAEDHSASASDIVPQQVKRARQRRQPFSLSVPMQSSIMLRRNARAESASGARSSTWQPGLHNVTPERVRNLISTLGHDDDLSETLFKLVMATAPFYNPKSCPAPSAPKESDPQAEALRQTLGGLMFSPQPPRATNTEKGPAAGNTNENPTGDLLFDANAAETLGSRLIEPRSDSPPLLWSTAAVEESLDPKAEDPKHYTVAEFINTIIENRIQVESVTEEDWQIEAVRVGILNHLMNNAPEGDPVAEGDLHDTVETGDQATEQIKTKVDTSKPDLTVKGDSSKEGVTEEKAPEQAQAKEDTCESDVQRWKAQGATGWREDEEDMNEEEIDDECARWDAMVRKAREGKKAETTGDRDGSGAVRLQNLDLDLGERFGSVAAQIETIGLATSDNKLTTFATAEAPDTSPPGKALKSLSQDSGLHSPSVYSEHDETGVDENAASDSSTSSDANSGLVRDILSLMNA